MRWLAFALIAFLCASLAWSTPRGETKKGNQAAEQGALDQALIHYKQALEQRGDTSVILYDLGNVMSQNGQFEDAQKSYLGSLSPKAPLREQAETLYNLGNTFFGEQKYDEAAKTYIESLKRNPEDEAAKYNLEIARRMLQQQQEQQQQQGDQQEEKSDQQEQKESQEQKDEQQQQEQPDQQQQQQQSQEEQQDQQQQARPDKQMSQEEAERILNALLQNEQDALKQAKKVKVKTRAKREKDW